MNRTYVLHLITLSLSHRCSKRWTLVSSFHSLPKIQIHLVRKKAVIVNLVIMSKKMSTIMINMSWMHTAHWAKLLRILLRTRHPSASKILNSHNLEWQRCINSNRLNIKTKAITWTKSSRPLLEVNFKIVRTLTIMINNKNRMTKMSYYLKVLLKIKIKELMHVLVSMILDRHCFYQIKTRIPLWIAQCQLPNLLEVQELC